MVADHDFYFHRGGFVSDEVDNGCLIWRVNSLI